MNSTDWAGTGGVALLGTCVAAIIWIAKRMVTNQDKVTDAFLRQNGTLAETLVLVKDHLKSLCDSQPDREELSRVVIDNTQLVRDAIADQTTANGNEHKQIVLALKAMQKALCRQLRGLPSSREQISEIIREILGQGEEDISAGELTARRVKAEEVLAEKIRTKHIEKVTIKS